MARLEYTIGPKPEGNYRIPVDMKLTFDDRDGLYLNPFLFLRKLYSLSTWGFNLVLGPENSEVIYVNGTSCRSISCFAIEWTARSVPKNQSEWVLTFHSLLCSHPLSASSKCAGCRIYAGWDTFTRDLCTAIENFILKMSTDIVTAWDEAISRAKEAVSLKEKKITVELPLQSALNLHQQNQNKNKAVVSRKIKIEK